MASDQLHSSSRVMKVIFIQKRGRVVSTPHLTVYWLWDFEGCCLKNPRPDPCSLVFQTLDRQQQKLSELMEICQQKDDIINKLQAAMDGTVENATRDVNAHFYFTSSSQSLSSNIQT